MFGDQVKTHDVGNWVRWWTTSNWKKKKVSKIPIL